MMPNINRLLNVIVRLGLVAALAVTLAMAVSVLPGLDGPAVAQEAGEVPGQALGNTSDSEFWREVRRGARGTVSIPDPNAGVMIQSEGENWRNFRNGPLSQFGGWVIVGMVVWLAFFFAFRGRIRIDSGFSGRLIERFNNLERIGHWLTAGTFILLGITGLNTMYGRYLFGGEATPAGEFGALHRLFALVVEGGKWAHNFLAFAFMAGLVMIFVLWVRDNIPSRVDLKWLAVGGGLFNKNVHPPAKKFNAGQKLIFWVVILGGLSMSLSGISLLFPFTIPIFAKTFAVLNVFGFGLPTDLAPIEEMQLSQLWHALVAVVMIAIIISHIYIGSLGMEGAWDAMGNGMVDENWAREHHGLWVAEVKGEAPASDDGGPDDGGGKSVVTDGEPQTA
jgi:formate dehydrogenase subunit gamma